VERPRGVTLSAQCAASPSVRPGRSCGLPQPPATGRAGPSGHISRWCASIGIRAEGRRGIRRSGNWKVQGTVGPHFVDEVALPCEKAPVLDVMCRFPHDRAHGGSVGSAAPMTTETIPHGASMAGVMSLSTDRTAWPGARTNVVVCAQPGADIQPVAPCACLSNPSPGFALDRASPGATV
jgi:hypothetical protein